MKTLAFVLSLEENEEFKLVDISGRQLEVRKFFGDSKSQGVTY